MRNLPSSSSEASMNNMTRSWRTLTGETPRYCRVISMRASSAWSSASLLAVSRGSPTTPRQTPPIVVVRAPYCSLVFLLVRLHNSLASPRSRAPTTARAGIVVRGSAPRVVVRLHASFVVLRGTLPSAAIIASNTTFWALGMMVVATTNKRRWNTGIYIVLPC